MELISVLLFACLFVWAWFHVRSIWQRRSVKYPPGPYRLPIIGNILHLSRSRPHISLANLAKQYGPLIYLKLGSLDTIVVSSPEMAKQVLQTHDHIFCGRPVQLGAQAYDFHQNSMAFLPAGDKWKTLRQISKELVLSTSQLDASERLRQEKLCELRGYIGKCCDEGHVINIGETASMTSISLMSATILSDDFGGFGSDFSHQIAQMAQEFVEVLGAPNVADFFPVLKVIDPQGILRRARNSYGKLLDFLQDMIDRRLVSGVIKDDFLQKLLHLSEESHQSHFSPGSIRFILLDLFAAGVDTVSEAVEWAMTELLRNPEKMSKLKDELDAVIGENGQVAESDISRLPYLQAVIKETLRYHPVAPLLLPHKTITEIEINDYTIPKNAHVLVNIWAMGRDPSVWPNADIFEPGRFIKSKIDYKGQDFQFTPFGSGRRMCPGWPLAHRMMPLILASLVHNFDWIIDAGMKPNEIDMTDTFGVVLKKAIPLKGIPVKTTKQST